MIGLQYVAAGIGRLLLFLYPTIVVIVSALVLGKRISRREVAAPMLASASSCPANSTSRAPISGWARSW
jgi:drug/metabolite transporter (DMT)-like permease